MKSFLSICIALGSFLNYAQAAESVLGCTGTQTGQGFNATFYSYPADSSAGESSDWFLNGFNTTGSVTNTATDVEDITFAGLGASFLGIGVSIDIYGISFSSTNFALELQGYFYASTSGDYVFTMLHSDDASSLQIGRKAGVSCCDGDFNSITDSSLTISRYTDILPQVKTVYLEAGEYYPIRVMYYNAEAVATLSLTVLEPGHLIPTQHFDMVHQLIPDCPVQTTTSLTPASTLSSAPLSSGVSETFVGASTSIGKSQSSNSLADQSTGGNTVDRVSSNSGASSNSAISATSEGNNALGASTSTDSTAFGKSHNSGNFGKSQSTNLRSSTAHGIQSDSGVSSGFATSATSGGSSASDASILTDFRASSKSHKSGNFANSQSTDFGSSNTNGIQLGTDTSFATSANSEGSNASGASMGAYSTTLGKSHKTNSQSIDLGGSTILSQPGAANGFTTSANTERSDASAGSILADPTTLDKSYTTKSFADQSTVSNSNTSVPSGSGASNGFATNSEGSNVSRKSNDPGHSLVSEGLSGTFERISTKVLSGSQSVVSTSSESSSVDVHSAHPSSSGTFAPHKSRKSATKTNDGLSSSYEVSASMASVSTERAKPSQESHHSSVVRNGANPSSVTQSNDAAGTSERMSTSGGSASFDSYNPQKSVTNETFNSITTANVETTTPHGSKSSGSVVSTHSSDQGATGSATIGSDSTTKVRPTGSAASRDATRAKSTRITANTGRQASEDSTSGVSTFNAGSFNSHSSADDKTNESAFASNAPENTSLKSIRSGSDKTSSAISNTNAKGTETTVGNPSSTYKGTEGFSNTFDSSFPTSEADSFSSTGLSRPKESLLLVSSGVSGHATDVSGNSWSGNGPETGGSATKPNDSSTRSDSSGSQISGSASNSLTQSNTIMLSVESAKGSSFGSASSRDLTAEGSSSASVGPQGLSGERPVRSTIPRSSAATEMTGYESRPSKSNPITGHLTALGNSRSARTSDNAYSDVQKSSIASAAIKTKGLVDQSTDGSNSVGGHSIFDSNVSSGPQYVGTQSSATGASLLDQSNTKYFGNSQVTSGKPESVFTETSSRPQYSAITGISRSVKQSDESSSGVGKDSSNSKAFSTNELGIKSDTVPKTTGSRTDTMNDSLSGKPGSKWLVASATAATNTLGHDSKSLATSALTGSSVSGQRSGGSSGTTYSSVKTGDLESSSYSTNRSHGTSKTLASGVSEFNNAPHSEFNSGDNAAATNKSGPNHVSSTDYSEATSFDRTNNSEHSARSAVTGFNRSGSHSDYSLRGTEASTFDTNRSGNGSKTSDNFRTDKSTSQSGKNSHDLSSSGSAKGRSENESATGSNTVANSEISEAGRSSKASQNGFGISGNSATTSSHSAGGRSGDDINNSGYTMTRTSQLTGKSVNGIQSAKSAADNGSSHQSDIIIGSNTSDSADTKHSGRNRASSGSSTLHNARKSATATSNGSGTGSDEAGKTSTSTDEFKSQLRSSSNESGSVGTNVVGSGSQSASVSHSVATATDKSGSNSGHRPVKSGSSTLSGVNGFSAQSSENLESSGPTASNTYGLSFTSNSPYGSGNSGNRLSGEESTSSTKTGNQSGAIKSGTETSAVIVKGTSDNAPYSSGHSVATNSFESGKRSGTHSSDADRSNATGADKTQTGSHDRGGSSATYSNDSGSQYSSLGLNGSGSSTTATTVKNRPGVQNDSTEKPVATGSGSSSNNHSDKSSASSGYGSNSAESKASIEMGRSGNQADSTSQNGAQVSVSSIMAVFSARTKASGFTGNNPTTTESQESENWPSNGHDSASAQTANDSTPKGTLPRRSTESAGNSEAVSYTGSRNHPGTTNSKDSLTTSIKGGGSKSVNNLSSASTNALGPNSDFETASRYTPGVSGSHIGTRHSGQQSNEGFHSTMATEASTTNLDHRSVLGSISSLPVESTGLKRSANELSHEFSFTSSTTTLPYNSVLNSVTHSQTGDTFDDAVSLVNSAASRLSSGVSAWNSNSGMSGAQGLQGYFSSLLDAFKTLSSDAVDLQSGDADPKVINSLTSAVAGALNALTAKAGDLDNVGANQMIQNDLNQLGSPAQSVLNDIIDSSAEDCSKAVQLQPARSALSAGFASADSAFGASQLTFATFKCPPRGSIASQAVASSASTNAVLTPSRSTADNSGSSKRVASQSGYTTGGSKNAETGTAFTSFTTTLPHDSSSNSATNSQAVDAFGNAVSLVNSAASLLSSGVSAWNSNSGMSGAKGMQGYFTSLLNAFRTLSSNAAGLQDRDVDPKVVDSLAGAVSGALTALTAKAGDLDNVGASQMIKNDLNQLGSPAQSVLNDIIDSSAEDCSKAVQLQPARSALSAGFASADSAFGASQLTFATFSCPSGSSTTSQAFSSTASSSRSGELVASKSSSTFGSSKNTETGTSTFTPFTSTFSNIATNSQAANDFDNAVSLVNSAASRLSSGVSEWSSNSGLSGAQGIQGYFNSLLNAFKTLSSDAMGLQDREVDPAVINSLASAVAGALTALTAKAGDLDNAGASQMIQDDLNQLGSPAQSVLNDIINASAEDCSKAVQLQSARSALSAGFASADSAFEASQLTFATFKCPTGGSIAPQSVASDSLTINATPTTSLCSTTDVSKSGERVTSVSSYIFGSLKSAETGTTSTSSTSTSTTLPYGSNSATNSQAVNAFDNAVSLVNSAASRLSNSASEWNSNSGVSGAQGMQGYFTSLLSAFETLSNDAAGLQDGDVDPKVINSLANAVAGALTALTAKAGDLDNVGASQIIQNDLNQLKSPAQSVLNDIFDASNGDCSKASLLQSARSALSAGFASANSAFGASQLTFATFNCPAGSSVTEAGPSQGSNSGYSSVTAGSNPANTPGSAIHDTSSLPAAATSLTFWKNITTATTGHVEPAESLRSRAGPATQFSNSHEQSTESTTQGLSGSTKSAEAESSRVKGQSTEMTAKATGAAALTSSLSSDIAAQSSVSDKASVLSTQEPGGFTKSAKAEASYAGSQSTELTATGTAVSHSSSTTSPTAESVQADVSKSSTTTTLITESGLKSQNNEQAGTRFSTGEQTSLQTSVKGLQTSGAPNHDSMEVESGSSSRTSVSSHIAVQTGSSSASGTTDGVPTITNSASRFKLNSVAAVVVSTLFVCVL